jgi:DDE superfamily endonuclease
VRRPLPTLRKKGAIEQLHTAPPAGSVVICLDGMGPQKAKSHPGRRLVRPAGPKADRARQEIDYRRRGVAGYVFGAFQPASGKAFTQPHERRTTTNRVDFLSAVEAWIDPASARVYAILDNLNTHSAPDVLLFSLLHPRCPSTPGGRLPTQIRGLPELDRALGKIRRGRSGAPWR